jgi:hypothetical protein
MNGRRGIEKSTGVIASGADLLGDTFGALDRRACLAVNAVVPSKIAVLQRHLNCGPHLERGLAVRPRWLSLRSIVYRIEQNLSHGSVRLLCSTSGSGPPGGDVSMLPAAFLRTSLWA